MFVNFHHLMEGPSPVSATPDFCRWSASPPMPRNYDSNVSKYLRRFVQGVILTPMPPPRTAPQNEIPQWSEDGRIEAEIRDFLQALTFIEDRNDLVKLVQLLIEREPDQAPCNEVLHVDLGALRPETMLDLVDAPKQIFANRGLEYPNEGVGLRDFR
jgi:hypothetical protein